MLATLVRLCIEPSKTTTVFLLSLAKCYIRFNLAILLQHNASSMHHFLKLSIKHVMSQCLVSKLFVNVYMHEITMAMTTKDKLHANNHMQHTVCFYPGVHSYYLRKSFFAIYKCFLSSSVNVFLILCLVYIWNRDPKRLFLCISVYWKI